MNRTVIVLGVLLLLVIGCASVDRQRETLGKQLREIFTECTGKAQQTGYAQVARCAQEPVRGAYTGLEYPYMDLVDLFLAQWTAIATKIDEGQVRPEEAQLQLMEQLFRVTAEAQRRDGQFERRWLLLSELRPSFPPRR